MNELDQAVEDFCQQAWFDSIERATQPKFLILFWQICCFRQPKNASLLSTLYMFEAGFVLCNYNISHVIRLVCLLSHRSNRHCGIKLLLSCDLHVDGGFRSDQLKQIKRMCCWGNKSSFDDTESDNGYQWANVFCCGNTKFRDVKLLGFVVLRGKDFGPGPKRLAFTLLWTRRLLE